MMLVMVTSPMVSLRMGILPGWDMGEG
jgi:hypothetical protein